jgi:hypothetical protein
VIRSCCYCKAHFGTKPGPADEITDGICPPCEAELLVRDSRIANATLSRPSCIRQQPLGEMRANEPREPAQFCDGPAGAVSGRTGSAGAMRSDNLWPLTTSETWFALFVVELALLNLAHALKAWR